MEQNYIHPMEEKYQEYLIDESKYTGQADSISFPESEAEILDIIKQSKTLPITIQGGMTGIVGGAVPNGGHIINLSHMTACKESGFLEDGSAYIIVEPGVTLAELKKEIARRFKKDPMVWAPEPTETSATIGGIAASNAQGINAFYYGDSKAYVEQIHMIRADGSIRVIQKGEELDLILGGEGIFGIISELTLRLINKPETIWGITFFFEDRENLGGFVDRFLEIRPTAKSAHISAVEYLDRATIDMIEARKEVMSKIKELPAIEYMSVGLIYFELEGSEEGIEELAEDLMELAMSYNSDPDKAWAVSGEVEVEKMKAFRHAAAESTNLAIEEVRREDLRITKLGTDMTIPGKSFLEVVDYYENAMKDSALNGCIFGHIGGSHLHVNILPKNYEEYKRGAQLLKEWANKIKEIGGEVVVEHGVGKLKKQLLDEDILSNYCERLIKFKEKIDPNKKWNQGNIFPGKQVEYENCGLYEASTSI